MLKAVIYYYYHNVSLKKEVANSLATGLKKLGYDILVKKVTYKSRLKPIENVKLCIYIGWSNYISRIISKYNCPKISVFDPPIRSDTYVKGASGYFGLCWNRPHSQYYYQNDLPNNRWLKLREKYKIEVHPWKKLGEYIVIAHKHEPDFNGNDRYEYFDFVVHRAFETGRKILICFRGGIYNKYINMKYKNRWEKLGCEFSDGIKGNLDNAYCLITSGGTTQTKAIFYGVPGYSIENNITNPLSIEKGVTNFLKDPSRPNRKKWLNWVAYQQWTLKEFRKSFPFKYLMSIKKYL